jgi:excisionase family DNA binding protein
MTPQNNSTDPALLSEAEARRFLGIGHTTLYALSSSGELSSVQIGRRRLWRRSDLSAYVASLPATTPGHLERGL